MTYLHNEKLVDTHITRDEMYANNLDILIKADRRARANDTHLALRISALEASLKGTRLVVAGTIGALIGHIFAGVFW